MAKTKRAIRSISVMNSLIVFICSKFIVLSNGQKKSLYFKEGLLVLQVSDIDCNFLIISSGDKSYFF